LFGLVYIATNKIDNKSYVGQTIQTLERRKIGHKSYAFLGSKFVFHKAIRNHGWDVFDWKVIKECNNRNELDQLELKCIKKYNTITPNGYNMTLYTGGNSGYDFSGENNPRYNDHRSYDEIHGKEKSNKIKREISKRMKNASNNISNWKKNNPSYNPMNNPESRKKLSKTRTGGNNPAAIYCWKFTLPNGKVYETDCMRQFCRETGFNRRILMSIVKNRDTNYKPRDKFYQGWLVEKSVK
jgi:group I intron endonuclease